MVLWCLFDVVGSCVWCLELVFWVVLRFLDYLVWLVCVSLLCFYYLCCVLWCGFLVNSVAHAAITHPCLLVLLGVIVIGITVLLWFTLLSLVWGCLLILCLLVCLFACFVNLWLGLRGFVVV